MRDRPLRQLLLQSKGGTLYWKGGSKGRRLPLFVQDDRELVTMSERLYGSRAVLQRPPQSIYQEYD